MRPKDWYQKKRAKLKEPMEVFNSSIENRKSETS